MIYTDIIFTDFYVLLLKKYYFVSYLCILDISEKFLNIII